MSDENSNSRTWFITGASSGLGRALAQAALARGDRVALAGRDLASLNDAIGDRGDLGTAYVIDVRDEQSIRRAVADAVASFGRLDVVANNAGYGLFGGVEEATDEQARAVFDTNVFGVLNVLRAVLPVLRAQRSGHVLQGSSLYGQTAHPGVGLLAATKYAVEGLSDALAAELAPLGIDVTLIEPGAMATPFLSRLTVAAPAPDYEGTVGAIRRSLGELSPVDLVDPARAALAVLAAVDSPRPPLRLALGSAGAAAMRTSLIARQSDLDEWAEVTDGVDSPVPV